MKKRLTSKIEGDNVLYLDELIKDEEIWIPKSKFIQYIKSTYLISPKDYFIEVMESKGIHDYNKCPNCGAETKWISLFSGYSKTCSTQCRNAILSKGNQDLVVVTKTGLITHVINQEILTKFKVNQEIQEEIGDGLTLPDLIEFLTENNCLWISGYNIRSIKYANVRDKNLRLKNSL